MRMIFEIVSVFAVLALLFFSFNEIFFVYTNRIATIVFTLLFFGLAVISGIGAIVSEIRKFKEDLIDVVLEWNNENPDNIENLS